MTEAVGTPRRDLTLCLLHHTTGISTVKALSNKVFQYGVLLQVSHLCFCKNLAVHCCQLSEPALTPGSRRKQFTRAKAKGLGPPSGPREVTSLETSTIQKASERKDRRGGNSYRPLRDAGAVAQFKAKSELLCFALRTHPRNSG